MKARKIEDEVLTKAFRERLIAYMIKKEINSFWSGVLMTLGSLAVLLGLHRLLF